MSRAGKILIAVFIATTTSGTAIAQPARSFGPGTFLVGSDIEPGLYRSEGEIRSFKRLSGLSGESSDIIAIELPPEGPVLIEIKATDVAFYSRGPGVWTKVNTGVEAINWARIKSRFSTVSLDGGKP